MLFRFLLNFEFESLARHGESILYNWTVKNKNMLNTSCTVSWLIDTMILWLAISVTYSFQEYIYSQSNTT